MRIGIFGGTFDPPHLGHLILAAEAVDQAKLDRLLWVLTPNPPHKKGKLISDVDIRRKMVNVLVMQSIHFELSTVDIDRPAPHYALDTVRLLQKEHPGSELLYLLGGDSLRDLHTWHQCDDFVKACSGIITYQRPHTNTDLSVVFGRFPELEQKTLFLDSPLIEISGEDIRSRVKEHRSYWQFVPSEVADIIQQEQLYL